MQEPDGRLLPITDADAGVLRRIAGAGGRELPIFRKGEVVRVRGGAFRVVAWGDRVLVLEGVSEVEGAAAEEGQKLEDQMLGRQRQLDEEARRLIGPTAKL